MMKKMRAHPADGNPELATLRFNGPVRAQNADGNPVPPLLPSATCARTGPLNRRVLTLHHLHHLHHLLTLLNLHHLHHLLNLHHLHSADDAD